MTDTATLTLTDFLLARIAEDEAWARSVADGGSGRWESWNRSWDPDPFRDIATDGERIATVPLTLDRFICTHDPARVLAECEAKRRIVEVYKHACDGGQPHSPGYVAAAEMSVALLAAVYSDHPDYRTDWA